MSDNTEIELEFNKASSQKDYEAVYNYTIDAFSDSPDFSWTLEDIKKEVKDGWELYSVSYDDEIIAAVFFQEVGDELQTKNTAVKSTHKGSGFSHQIKNFLENKARELKLKRIVHYCRIDNFRMYSLNESHGYKKSDKKYDNGQVVEWVKNL